MVVTTEIIDGPNQVIRAHFQMIRILTNHIDVIFGPAPMISDPSNHIDGDICICKYTMLYFDLLNITFNDFGPLQSH